MRITLFTSNQPRHVSLVETLCAIAEEVYVVQECNTLFPGQVADFFQKSAVMQDYFSRVLAAERTVFGQPRFLPTNARSMPIKMGDLNRLPFELLQPALQSDVYVIFGASFIKGELCAFLSSHRALNIHMGTSPYYRGSSTNFWALYDSRPEYVGATIHLLTAGLDSGPMLFHAFPPTRATEPFELGMRAVQSAHQALANAIATGEVGRMAPVVQDKSLELRYTRNADFTDAVAAEYLGRLATPEQVGAALAARDLSQFLHPRIP